MSFNWSLKPSCTLPNVHQFGTYHLLHIKKYIHISNFTYGKSVCRYRSLRSKACLFIIWTKSPTEDSDWNKHSISFVIFGIWDPLWELSISKPSRKLKICRPGSMYWPVCSRMVSQQSNSHLGSRISARKYLCDVIKPSSPGPVTDCFHRRSEVLSECSRGH